MSAPSTVVIGGGISGLACAYRLQELGLHEVGLFEAGSRLGGTLESIQKGGFTLEGGPDCFISDRSGLMDWLERTGLKPHVIGTESSNRRSFIYNNGKMSSIPPGFYLISPTSAKSLFTLPHVSLWGKLRMALEPWMPAKASPEDESVAMFIRRRLGQEALVKIGQPMIGGIYSADPERLSLKAAMPRFYEMERDHGSLARALAARRKSSAEHAASGPRYSLFLSMEKGMGQMISGLEEKLQHVDIRRNFRIRSLKYDVSWKIISENGEAVDAESVCLALPAYESARLVREFAPELAELLESIPYESAATINLAYRDEDLPEIPRGFGFVVPAEQNRRITGCTFANLKFPGRAPDARTLVRVFIGGAFHPGLAELSEDELLQIAESELEHMLGIRKKALFSMVRRHPRAMPQYHVGHLEKVAEIFEAAGNFPGLYLTGNAYRGVGIPDCVAQAEQTADQMVRDWRERG